MQKNTNINNSGIVLKERNEIKPSEVDLNYLINDIQAVKNIKKHDYDIHIDSLDLSLLSFISAQDKSNLKTLFKHKGVLSIDKAYDLKLLDLSTVGLGFAPDAQSNDDENKKQSSNKSFRYSYLNNFIDCINQSIKKEIEREKIFSDKWKNQHLIVTNKFNRAQCKDKAGFFRLYSLKHAICYFIKKIAKLKKTVKLSKIPIADKLKSMIINMYSFLSRHFILGSENLNNKSVFNELGMKYSEQIFDKQGYSTVYLVEVLLEYEYFLKYYNLFLSSTLEQLKKKKINKASKIFTTDSYELKAESLKHMQNLDYSDYVMYNSNKLYDYFRQSFIKNIHAIIDASIKRRQIIDGVFQYVPSVIGTLVSVTLLIMLFGYNYTLLKKIEIRHRLLIIFGAISICAVVALINLFRNSKQFKRPKRLKFSISSLVSYVFIAVMFFGLYTYFINRYDGYDDIYYYVNSDEGKIKIDGLVKKKDSSFVIPQTIDGLDVVIVSKNTFQKNENVRTVDFSNTNVIFEESSFKNCKNLINVLFSDSMEYVPSNSFKNCRSLTTIDLKNIQSIEKGAFVNCSKLRNIDISQIIKLEDYAFQNCNELRNIAFNKNLTVIPKGAFKNCYLLRFASLPDNLAEIKESAFSNCYRIVRLELAAKIQTIEKNAFGNCYNIDECKIEDYSVFKDFDLTYVFGKDGLKKASTISISNCTEIPNNGFADYTNLEKLEIEGRIQRIGKNAFKNCSRLSKLTFDGNCTYIGEGAFANCSMLSSIDFEKLSITKIYKNTFYNCTRLESFAIPNTVTEIGKEAFSGCRTFNTITIPSSVKKIEKKAYYGCTGINELIVSQNTIIEENAFGKCVNIKHLSIPLTMKPIYIILGSEISSKLTSIEILAAANAAIPNYFFSGCTKLEAISIRGNITSIGEYAFYNCNSLKNFEIPSSVKTINDFAFANCIAFREVNIPDNVRHVGIGIFYGCKYITKAKVGINNTKSFNNYFSNGDILNLIDFTLYGAKSIPNDYFRDFTNLKLFDFSGFSQIGSNAFNNTGLADINIANISEIENAAFANCAKLQNVAISPKLIRISDSLFENCIKLQSFDFENISYVGIRAFKNCRLLTEVIFSKKEITIKKDAFSNCYSLENLVMPELTNWFSRFRLEQYFDADTLNNIKSLKIYNASKIDSKVLDNCNNIKTIHLIGTISKIDEYAFDGLEKLENVFLPQTIKVIDKYAFRNCKSLVEVNLPTGLERIEKRAFSGCGKLETIYLPTDIYYIGKEAFGDTNADIKNIDKYNQINLDNWHKDWDSKDMHNSLLSTMEDINIAVYIMIFIIFVSIIAFSIIIRIKCKKKK